MLPSRADSSTAPRKAIDCARKNQFYAGAQISAVEFVWLSPNAGQSPVPFVKEQAARRSRFSPILIPSRTQAPTATRHASSDRWDSSSGITRANYLSPSLKAASQRSGRRGRCASDVCWRRRAPARKELQLALHSQGKLHGLLAWYTRDLRRGLERGAAFPPWVQARERWPRPRSITSGTRMRLLRLANDQRVPASLFIKGLGWRDACRG